MHGSLRESEEQAHSKWKQWLSLFQYLCLYNCGLWGLEGPGLPVFGEHADSYILIRVRLLFQKFTTKHFMQSRAALVQLSVLKELAKVS